MTKKPRLTAKQEAFAQAIVDGKRPSEAFRLAYPDQKASPKIVSVKAAQAQNHPTIAGRIAELRGMLTKKKTLERDEKRLLLAATVRGTKELSDAQMKAIEIDNKMAGHNEPEQLKVTGLGSLLQKIRQSAPKP